MKFLVIGGAGYIGSHFVDLASRQNHECVVLDNLSTGHRESISSDIEFIKADLMDPPALKEALNKFKPDAVFHFAACSLVGESVKEPRKYYINNVEGLRNLLDEMRAYDTNLPLIFSSTCAVFGEPTKLPLSEDDVKRPISPYGRSKLMAEFVIEDYAKAYGMKAMALRYFNACGASLDGHIGECHDPETHLIPNVMKAIKAGKTMNIFGNDFPTKDGTCVRDYIHVYDLSQAHIDAAIVLTKEEKGHFDAIHLGTGNGYSNLEIVTTIAKVMEVELEINFTERREGDPPALYANNEKAKRILDFSPKYSDLETIIKSAFSWHESHPNGYSS